MIGFWPVERWRCKRRNRKTWKECVDDDTKVLDLRHFQGYMEGLHKFIWAKV